MSPDRRFFSQGTTKARVELDGSTVFELRQDTASGNLTEYTGRLVEAASPELARKELEAVAARYAAQLMEAPWPDEKVLEQFGTAFPYFYGDPRFVTKLDRRDIELDRSFADGDRRARIILFEDSIVSVVRSSGNETLRTTYECGWDQGALDKANELELALVAEGFRPIGKPIDPMKALARTYGKPPAELAKRMTSKTWMSYDGKRSEDGIVIFDLLKLASAASSIEVRADKKLYPFALIFDSHLWYAVDRKTLEVWYAHREAGESTRTGMKLDAWLAALTGGKAAAKPIAKKTKPAAKPKAKRRRSAPKR